MLNAEWPTLERTIAVCSDPSGSRGRVVPLLKENVTLPATLRVRNWIDFRDPEKFEDSFTELIRYLRGESIARGKGSFLPSVPATPPPFEPSPILITASVGADRVNERLVTNLYRVTSLPETVFYAATNLRKKKDINNYCEKVPPFILRDGNLYTFSDLNASESFRPVIKKEPTYLLTKDDGKSPRTNKWVGPILSHWLNQERNGQILRTLRFWSLVLARAKELVIETGQTPIHVDLTPVSGMLDFGIASDQVNFDKLMEAEIEDDSVVPQLELFGEESSIAYTEEVQFAEEDREDETALES